MYKCVVWCDGETHWCVYDYKSKRFYDNHHNIENELLLWEMSEGSADISLCTRVALYFILQYVGGCRGYPEWMLTKKTAPPFNISNLGELWYVSLVKDNPPVEFFSTWPWSEEKTKRVFEVP